jgi:hypothetical protein
MMLRAALILLIAIGAAFGAAAVAPGLFSGSSRSQAAQVALPPRRPDVMQRVLAGMPGPYENGEPIPIAGKVQGEFRLSPIEESSFGRRVEVTLYEGTTDSPVQHATVNLNASMHDMSHTDQRVAMQELGGGKYGLNLPFGMPGDWDLIFTFGGASGQATVSLMVTIAD